MDRTGSNDRKEKTKCTPFELNDATRVERLAEAFTSGCCVQQR